MPWPVMRGDCARGEAVPGRARGEACPYMSLFPFLPSAMVVQRPAAAAFKAGRLCLPLNDTRLDHKEK
jgi:hypothetical protein